MIDYKQKYLKYKIKYLLFKQKHNLIGGMESNYPSPIQNMTESSKYQQNAPKRERPRTIIETRVEMLRESMLEDIIDNLKKKYERKTEELDEEDFKTLFNIVFQLDNTDIDEVMIINLMFFITDLYHDYNNYQYPHLNETPVRTLINKYIKMLKTIIKNLNYTLDLDDYMDNVLNQKYVMNNDVINQTFASLLLRKELELADFSFKSIKIKEFSLYPENVLQDQGYNPSRIKGATKIEIDGLHKIVDNNLLGTNLKKTNIYKFITKKWLEYIFNSLCRLELNMFTSEEKEMYSEFEHILSSIMRSVKFSIDTESYPWSLSIRFITEEKEVEIDKINISGVSKEVFDEIEISDKFMNYAIAILNEIPKHSILDEKNYKTLIKNIIRPRLRDIIRAVFCSLKTLGDKSYEFLLIVFIMKYIKNSENNKFLIETKDNHFINSYFLNIIPLIRILNSDSNEKNKIELAFRFPANKKFVPYDLRNDKNIAFVYNSNIEDPVEKSVEKLVDEVFYTPPLNPKSEFSTPGELLE